MNPEKSDHRDAKEMERIVLLGTTMGVLSSVALGIAPILSGFTFSDTLRVGVPLLCFALGTLAAGLMSKGGSTQQPPLSSAARLAVVIPCLAGVLAVLGLSPWWGAFLGAAIAYLSGSRLDSSPAGTGGAGGE